MDDITRNIREGTPCCFDCLSEDVAVRLIDPHGFEYWLCAECDAGWREFRERLMALLGEAANRLLVAAEPRAGEGAYTEGGYMLPEQILHPTDELTRIIRDGTAAEQISAGLVDADADAIHAECGGRGGDGCNNGWAE